MITIVHYGLGNIYSLKSCIEKSTNNSVVVGNDLECMPKSPTHIILPGVGSFNHAMLYLEDKRLTDYIRHHANNGCYILGICLGMQLLGKYGSEGGLHEGLGFINGRTDQIEKREEMHKIPHYGWSKLNYLQKNEIITEDLIDEKFYFVHSYAYTGESITTTYTNHGDYAAAVQHQRIFGVQFHPEKSRAAGAKIMKNFLSLK